MRAPVLILALALAGCSGDETDNENPGAQAGSPAVAASDRCLTSCEADATCQGFPSSGCSGDIDCNGWPGAAWRDEVASAYLDCQSMCPNDPNACSQAAFAAAGMVRAVDMEYADACDTKRASCGSFPNNICGEEALYVESAVVDAMRCLGMPCEGVGDCVKQHFK